MTWSAPADRTSLELGCAGHTGDLGPERLGDLHREGPDSSGRADDQHLLPGRDLPAVAHGLQRGEGRDGRGGGLLEGEVGRLGRELVRPADGVLGEGSLGDAVDVVARFQGGDVLADGLDPSGDLTAPYSVFRDTQPVARQPDRVGQAGHDVPDAPVHTGGMHPQQHLVGARLRPVDLLEPQDVGLAVDVLDDRLHRRRRPAGTGVCCCLSGSLLGSHHARPLVFSRRWRDHERCVVGVVDAGEARGGRCRGCRRGLDRSGWRGRRAWWRSCCCRR